GWVWASVPFFLPTAVLTASTITTSRIGVPLRVLAGGRPSLAAMEANLATVHEAIAAAVPEREAIVFRDRRLTFAQVTERSRRFANALLGHGVGCHVEREHLERHESGQDHVALYLRNGNEYLEAMLGSYKARAAPFNVNYRYVADELRQLVVGANARVVVYHAEFAPVLERVLDDLLVDPLLIQVADDSGNDLLPGAAD